MEHNTYREQVVVSLLRNPNIPPKSENIPNAYSPKPEIEYHIKSNYSSTALRVLRHIGDVKLSYQVLLICNISSCKLHIDIFLILLFLFLSFRHGVICLIKIQSFLPDDRRRRCRPGFCQRLCLWQQE